MKREYKMIKLYNFYKLVYNYFMSGVIHENV
ncbi:hypothetical protein HY04AAS1_0536 [Hydrogenobaculum sp. Y04AAS1]|nr:hypothetical protein HY04AAS1_0536 [Hydrogenobaculum sp. Y04AAS1]